MQHTTPTLAKAAILALGLCTSAANAALVLKVDTSAKEYYFEGSATGAVSSNMEDMSSVYWDNGQSYGMNGDYSPNMLTDDMLLVLGLEPMGPAFFVHGPGNINGGLDFFGEFSSITIVGNAEARGSYASWNPSVIATFETKALSGEVITAVGDSNFNIQFAAVPEPSAALLGLLGMGGLVLRRRR